MTVFYIKDDSNIDPNSIFIVVRGIDPTSGKPSFVDFSGTDGLNTAVSPQTDSTQYGYPLTHFTKTTQGYEVHIDDIYSARIYFSIGSPLAFSITADPKHPGSYLINDPSGTDTRDLNYHTIYDKVEFNLKHTSPTEQELYINPTAVDFFSLPLHIVLGSDQSGISLARTAAVQQIGDTMMSLADPHTHTEWQKCTLSSTYGTDHTVLRISSPSKAIDPSSPKFSKSFLDGYIAQIWNTFQGATQLIVDCSELQNDKDAAPDAKGLKSYTMYCSVRQSDGRLIVTNSAGEHNDAWDIPGIPTTAECFSGSDGVLQADNHTVKSIIVKCLSAAIESGVAMLLPTTPGVILSKDTFSTMRTSFYQNSKFADVYAAAMHSLDTTTSRQPIYAFAYDDLLGQDGTLTTTGDNIGPISITLGDMRGVYIPSIWKNMTTSYKVSLNLGMCRINDHNGNPEKFYSYGLRYHEEKLDDGSITYTSDQRALPGSATIIQGQQFHCTLFTFNGVKYTISLDNNMITPRDSISDGIAITQDANDPFLWNLMFPGPAVDYTGPMSPNPVKTIHYTDHDTHFEGDIPVYLVGVDIDPIS